MHLIFAVQTQQTVIVLVVPVVVVVAVAVAEAVVALINFAPRGFTNGQIYYSMAHYSYL